jgi:hypothetical protein
MPMQYPRLNLGSVAYSYRAGDGKWYFIFVGGRYLALGDAEARQEMDAYPVAFDLDGTIPGGESGRKSGPLFHKSGLADVGRYRINLLKVSYCYAQGGDTFTVYFVGTDKPLTLVHPEADMFRGLMEQWMDALIPPVISTTLVPPPGRPLRPGERADQTAPPASVARVAVPSFIDRFAPERFWLRDSQFCSRIERIGRFYINPKTVTYYQDEGGGQLRVFFEGNQSIILEPSDAQTFRGHILARFAPMGGGRPPEGPGAPPSAAPQPPPPPPRDSGPANRLR